MTPRRGWIQQIERAEGEPLYTYETQKTETKQNIACYWKLAFSKTVYRLLVQYKVEDDIILI